MRKGRNRVEPTAQTKIADHNPPAICPACRISLENFLPNTAGRFPGIGNHSARGETFSRLKISRLIFVLGMLGVFTLGKAADAHHEARGFAIRTPTRAFFSDPGNCYNFATPILSFACSIPVHSSGKDRASVPSGPGEILAYILQMEMLCQRLHRHDLAAEYREAWETAALAIYGPLPPRREAQPTIAQEPPKEKTIPRWRQEKFARPMRRVIAVYGDFEILECGHKVWRPVHLADEPQAKHRRCKDCLEVQKQSQQKKRPQKNGPATEEKEA